MKNRIIEICELGQPKSIIHRENEPITELIKTEVLIKELNEAINYTHSYILGDLKDKTKMEIPKLIEREDEFCESIDCERTEDTRQFIYDSRNDKSVMNLPYVLLEYKQWLIDEGFIKELK